jgi:hypothetical protein
MTSEVYRLRESEAIGRVLERAKRGRNSRSRNSDEDILKEQLGGEILHALGELLGDPNLIESLRLFIGSEVEPIILFIRYSEEERESYALDTVGRLVYTWTDTLWDVEADEAQGVRRVVLEKVTDFRGLSLDSMAGLHAMILGGDLWERLAWRLGREGKPGFHPGGFLEEFETWRYLSADPEEVPEAAKRTRAARSAARRGKTR